MTCLLAVCSAKDLLSWTLGAFSKYTMPQTVDVSHLYSSYNIFDGSISHYRMCCSNHTVRTYLCRIGLPEYPSRLPQQIERGITNSSAAACTGDQDSRTMQIADECREKLAKRATFACCDEDITMVITRQGGRKG